MIVKKRYFFQCHPCSSSIQPTNVFVDIIEKLDDENYPIFTWPSSVLLSAFLFHQKNSPNPIVHLNNSTTVIELGAGTALPSLLCAKFGIGHCYVTERDDQPEMLQHIQDSISLNKTERNSSVLPLSWGYNAFESFEVIPTVDLLLGADIFYSIEDFDSILFNVFQLLVKNPTAVFLTTYQQRDSNHSIEHLMAKYCLIAQYISKKEFLHPSHSVGECEVLVCRETECISSAVPLEVFDDIYLIKITLLQDSSNI